MAAKNDVYPLLCKPLLKAKIWGGRKLEKLFKMDLPPNEKIGEAWIVADLPEGSSGIINGSLAGKTLSEVSLELGEKLIGSAWSGRPVNERFPLLIKYLDAEDDLSVQVHPDDEACRTHFPNDFSKDESWIILHAEPGGRILHGFQPGTTLDDFDRLLPKGKIVDCLQSHDVSPGESFRVAPGTVHALCKGVAILEIQEPSDTTFRIYDYNRPGDDGKPRQLHLEQARKVMNFVEIAPSLLEPPVSERPWGTHELLVDVPAYRIERAEINKGMTWKVDPASAQVLILLDGKAEIGTESVSVKIKKGDCVILPAAIGAVQFKPETKSAKCVLAGAWRIPMLGRGKNE